MTLHEERMLGNDNSDSGSDAPLVRGPQPTRSHFVVTGALLMGMAVLALLFGNRGNANSGMPVFLSKPVFTQLEEEDVCGAFPHFTITDVVSSNLGGKGPDTSAAEGIVYGIEGHHLGLNQSRFELHLHVTNDSSFQGTNVQEGEEIGDEYDPAWPKENGYKDKFARINFHPGTNTGLTMFAYDPVKKQQILLPQFVITFFDLDTGKDNTTIEFVKTKGFSSYYISNETEIKVEKGDSGVTTFLASKEGDGQDNPTNPLELSLRQKNRAVSVQFQDVKEVLFELGCSSGNTPRVFEFVGRPIMRCASTKLADGTLVDANAPDSPIKVIKTSATSKKDDSSGEHRRPAMLLVLCSVLIATQRWI